MKEFSGPHVAPGPQVEHLWICSFFCEQNNHLMGRNRCQTFSLLCSVLSV